MFPNDIKIFPDIQSKCWFSIEESLSNIIFKNLISDSNLPKLLKNPSP